MRLLLLPLSFLFRIIVFFRNTLYNSRIFKAKVLNPVIISVGNIAAGGTGKTPLVEIIAEYLLNKNKSVAIVIRGYKREHDDIKVVEVGFMNTKHELNTENMGDEALMLLENLTNIDSGRGLLIVGDDKTKSAKFASAKFKPDVILIDDGFQHRKLFRDLDIVILTSDHNVHMLPAGNLREPLKNYKRAGILVFNKKFDLDYIPPNLKNKPQVICSYIFEGIKDFAGNTVQVDNSAGATVFCGIGEPESFRQLLVREKIIINDFMKFPDHHNFTNKDITKIIDSCNRSASGSLITTQKDFVRIKNSELVLKAKSENLYKNLLFNYPLYYAKIKMQIEKNAEILHKDIDNLLNSE